jgi:hypothetical protein
MLLVGDNGSQSRGKIHMGIGESSPCSFESSGHAIEGTERGKEGRVNLLRDSHTLRYDIERCDRLAC